MRVIFLCFLLLCVQISYAQQSAYDEEIRRRFVVESEPVCKRVKATEPKRPKTPFFSQRYYLTIDGGENCQILDVWIQRLTDSPADNRREIYSMLYRFNSNAWVVEYGLDTKPTLRVKDKKTGIVYFVTELNEDIFYRKQVFFFSGKWMDKTRGEVIGGIESLGLCQNIPVFECQFIESALERLSWLELRK